MPPVTFCTTPAHVSWGICNTSLGTDERAADIVSRISLQDKYQALNTATPRLGSVGLSSYQWWSEATHGISGPGVHHTAALPGATNTGLPITTSCSFNRSLWHATGNAIAREGRAYFNLGLAGTVRQLGGGGADSARARAPRGRAFPASPPSFIARALRRPSGRP